MASVEFDKRPTQDRRRRADRRDFWLIYCLVYPQFLAAVAVSRLLGRRTAPNKSIFAEAKAAAASCIPFAFR